MNKRKLWIMDELSLDSFDQYRFEKYRAVGIKGEINDDLLTQYHTYIMVHFFRKRRFSKQNPYQAEKFIHTAVCLYKRFYLVNEYGDNQHTQNALCCIYLSLKMNEIREESILQYARAWKNKKEFFNEDCLHFGDPGYSEKELHLLRGIGFQVARSPLIPSIESLYHSIDAAVQQKDYLHECQKWIMQYIRRVCTDHKALFLHEGPKLGLAIILLSIKTTGLEEKLNTKLEDLLGPRISSLVDKNESEIARIIDYLNRTQKFDLEEEKRNQVAEMRDKLVKTKKRTFEVPEKKSPKITPLNHSFYE